MENITKKVWIDLLAAPSTLIPGALGATSLLASWAIESGELAFIGLAGLAIGTGMLATRLIFGIEEITNEIYQKILALEEEQRQKELDDLAQRLRIDNHEKTGSYLRKLRSLYKDFHNDIKSEKISGVTGKVTEKVEEIFQACVAQLEYNCKLWESYRVTKNKKILVEREAVVNEVKKTIDLLAATTKEFHSFQIEKSTSNLSNLRRELESTMNATKRAEKQMAEIMGASNDAAKQELEKELEATINAAKESDENSLESKPEEKVYDTQSGDYHSKEHKTNSTHSGYSPKPQISDSIPEQFNITH